MDDDAARIGLVRVAEDFEPFAEVARQHRQRGLLCEAFGESVLAFDAALRARNAGLRQDGRAQTDLTRMRRHHRRADGPVHGAYARRLRRRNADGAAHGTGIELEQLAGRNSRADAAGDTGLRPGDAAFCGRHGDRLAEATHDFDPQCERRQEVAPGNLPALGQRQHRGHDRTARMHDGLGMRVVESVDAGAQAVDEAGRQDVRLAAAPDERGLRLARKRQQRCFRHRDGIVA